MCKRLHYSNNAFNLKKVLTKQNNFYFCTVEYFESENLKHILT